MKYLLIRTYAATDFDDYDLTTTTEVLGRYDTIENAIDSAQTDLNDTANAFADSFDEDQGDRFNDYLANKYMPNNADFEDQKLVLTNTYNSNYYIQEVNYYVVKIN